jgi:hypothetical protein
MRSGREAAAKNAMRINPQKKTAQGNTLRDGEWKCSNLPRSSRARLRARI